MVKIIAIGGGEIGRSNEQGGNYPCETISIDKEIISQSGKEKPKLLFIPTASSDSETYFEVVKKYFSKLGCEVDVLFLLKEKYSLRMIENKILSSDIIYVGGGNTLKMMTMWRKFGVDRILKKALEKDIVLSGVSAGAICWFSNGNSDSRKFTSNSNKLIKVRGLGFVNALICPHFDKETNREVDLQRMMKTTSKIVGLAIDNCSALEIIDSKYRVLKSKTNSNVYKVYWKKGKYIKQIIESKKEFSDLKLLLSK